MRIRSFLLYAFFGFSVAAAAQDAMTVTGAPFTATWTTTTDKAGTVTTSKTVVARLIDGSVYRAVYRDGNPDSIEIDDVPQKKRIILRPQVKQYTETTPPRGYWVTRTREQHHAILAADHVAYKRDSPGRSKDTTPLDIRVVGDMTMYGSHFVRTKDNERTMEGETWLSDLGLTYSQRYETPRDKTTVSSVLTDLKRSEPDASLFVVPKDYTLVSR